jgi:serralysin
VSVFVFGSAGADTIIGSEAGDGIIGAGGKDTMTGGPGADTYYFDSIAEIGKKKGKADSITDFTPGVDRIDLSSIDANGKKKGDKAFKFKDKEGTKLKKAGDLVYEQVDKKGTAKDMTVVYGDTNGDRKADFAIELKGIVDLSKGDFIL